MLMQASRSRPTSAHVIVLGNEKGGAGKSTIAMHVAVALLNFGQRVAARPQAGRGAGGMGGKARGAAGAARRDCRVSGPYS